MFALLPACQPSVGSYQRGAFTIYSRVGRRYFDVATFRRSSVLVDQRLGRTRGCGIGAVSRLRRGLVGRLLVAARRTPRTVPGGSPVGDRERRVKAGVAQAVNVAHC